MKLTTSLEHKGTTAGWKSTFAYDKLIQILVGQITQPEKFCVLGGTWRIPKSVGLLDKNFVRDLKLDGTFNESSFDREYESKWSGTVEDAFFQVEQFDRNRILNQPEYEHSGRSLKTAYYILSVDVGRKHDSTIISVFKVTPQPTGISLKSLVNMYSLNDEHFEDQAVMIKRLYYKYKARRIVIDANGLKLAPCISNNTSKSF